jgi:hypothetical protein
VWFRRRRLFIVSPDSRGTACPLSGRNSTYRPVQILEAGSLTLEADVPTCKQLIMDITASQLKAINLPEKSREQA